MKKAMLKTIESNDLVSLYSICFDNAEESEFEKFLGKFREESTLNKDFQTILVALSKVIERGALERFLEWKEK